MTYTEFMLRYAVPSNRRTDRICRALERRGKRFLIDFGIDNAEWELRRLVWELRRLVRALK